MPATAARGASHDTTTPPKSTDAPQNANAADAAIPATASTKSTAAKRASITACGPNGVASKRTSARSAERASVTVIATPNNSSAENSHDGSTASGKRGAKQASQTATQATATAEGITTRGITPSWDTAREPAIRRLLPAGQRGAFSAEGCASMRAATLEKAGRPDAHSISCCKSAARNDDRSEGNSPTDGPVSPAPNRASPKPASGINGKRLSSSSFFRATSKDLFQ